MSFVVGYEALRTWVRPLVTQHSFTISVLSSDVDEQGSRSRVVGTDHHEVDTSKFFVL